ncbi:MAG: T9SS type A sorting domain-containing protein [Candidatus Kapabacteria bacterium]|nr:T9SS type A sorting domain-containing protein [Candidatus Kapabacteria bacterium]
MTHTLRNILAVIVLALASLASGSAQQIVNDYTRVVSLETINCRSRVTVDSLASFAVGDRVLIIQTLGCTSTTSYDVSNVGICEFSTIASVAGRTFELAFPLVNTYSICGAIQLVRVPEFTNHTVTTTITGRPWDGRVGGIVVVDVRGTLTLRAGIRADTLGFRGGQRWQGGGDCSVTIDDDVTGSSLSAAKGETFVRPLPNMVAGGRALYSGGGGGRGHNSGGGGGGNGGIGGRGGSQWQGCGSYFDNGGRPGASAAILLNGRPTLRFGGGGGAGHMNNNNGTSGARGGGLVIVRCDTIIGNQNVISALGGAPPLVGSNDGAGGGGAGGTVHIELKAAIGPLGVVARGGAGGSINTGGLHGPGGGGGGGSLSISQPATPGSLTFDLAGGVNGRNAAFADPRSSDYLAESGQAGSVAYRSVIAENLTPPPPILVEAIPDYTLCFNDSLVLDCSVTGEADSITWTDSRGRIVGRTTRIGLRARATDTFVVRVVGPTGCWDTDTVTVSVREPWNVSFDRLDLGVLRCAVPIDTFIVLRNRMPRVAPITLWTVSDSTLVRILTPVDSVAALDSVRVRVRISPGESQGSRSATITAVVSPCDSAFVGRIDWQRTDRVIDLKPDTVIMPTVETCTSRSTQLDVSLVIDGADVVVENVLSDDFVSIAQNTPFTTLNGRATPVTIIWTPTRSTTSGRLGFVIRDSACLDTLWMTVTGKVKAPFLVAPALVQADTVVLCRDSVLLVRIPVTADTATPWVVDSITCTGPGTVLNPRGDTLRGTDTILVQVQPGFVGNYEVVAQIRLVPCDTVVTIRIRGTAIDVAMQATPLIRYTERYIGRRQILQATFLNTGTTPATIGVVSVPSAPFRILRFEPPPPLRLLPGQSIVVDVEYLQTYGSFADSIVLDVVDPCPLRLVTQLRGIGTAVTRVRIPDVSVATGQTVSVPVLLEGRPDIAPEILDSFAVQFAWNASEASASAGESDATAWRVDRAGDSSLITIIGKWNGTDTLAVVPFLSLLSVSDATGLNFDRSRGFAWTDQQSDIEYDDGSLTMDDICAGRRLRNVAVRNTPRPSVRPLPVDDVLHVVFPAHLAGNSFDITITDAQGRLLHSSKHTGADVSVDVSHLASGQYFVRISSDTSIYSTPIIVR